MIELQENIGFFKNQKEKLLRARTREKLNDTKVVRVCREAERTEFEYNVFAHSLYRACFQLAFTPQLCAHR